LHPAFADEVARILIVFEAARQPRAARKNVSSEACARGVTENGVSDFGCFGREIWFRDDALDKRPRRDKRIGVTDGGNY
jgi:hypothetical protein